MAARTVDPGQMAAAWKAGMGSAGAKYTAGINKVTESPMAKAATPEAMQRYQDGVMRSIANGKRVASLNASPLSTWKQNATTFGASNLSQGAAKGAPKYAAQAQKWAPILASASQAAAAVTGPKSHGTAVAKVAANLQVIMTAAGTM